MISAAACCAAKGSYYGFECAVTAGYTDLVRYLWQKTTTEEHNGMLLAEHCSTFCRAAASGALDIVQLLWGETTKTQRWVMLFEQSGAAIHKAAVNGHLEVVKLLWADMEPGQKRQLLGTSQGEAFVGSAGKGHLEICQFLWDNMDGGCRQYLLDSLLGPALARAVQGDRKLVVDFLLGLPGDSGTQLRRAVLAEEAVALAAAMEAGDSADNWGYAEMFYQILKEGEEPTGASKVSAEAGKVVAEFVATVKRRERMGRCGGQLGDYVVLGI